MTPEQKIKHAILLKAIEWENIEPISEPITAENVDALYDTNNEDYELQDARDDFRCGGVETSIPAPPSRHYESESRAMQLPDGSWVGWTYWFGGGKHGEPEAIDWMEDAYELDCVEEQKTVTVRTFTEKEGQPA